MVHQGDNGTDLNGACTGFERVLEKESGTFKYYLKLVPTEYVKLDGMRTFASAGVLCLKALTGNVHCQYRIAGSRLKTNQYSVTEYDTPVHKGEMQMPAVWFIYDISPITATITESTRSFAHLLVRICAVVGGVFAVTGGAHMHALPLLAVMVMFMRDMLVVQVPSIGGCID